VLAPQTINELSVILREEFGANLADVEVFEIGTTLVDLFSHLHELDRKDGEKQKVEDQKENENEKTKLLPTV
jgi:hypothetical protein